MSRRFVETEELVGVSEIATLVGVTSQAVANWSHRYSDFPEPLVRLEMGPVYEWKDIAAWLEKTGRAY